jgi:CBS domain-containing protein
MEVMYSSPVFTLTMQNSLHDALVLMKANFIKRIVIVRGKKPIGIITERDISRFLEKDNTSRSLDEIPTKEVMKKNLIMITLGQTDHMEQCATRMITFKIGSIIVVDEEGDLVGITTQTDIARSYAAKYPGKYKVKDYMTEKVVTCRDSDSLRFALEVINKNEISRLIATNSNGNVKGVITTNSYLKRSEYFKNSTKTRNYLLPERTSDKGTVGDLIDNEILIVEPDEDLANAASLMIKNNISGIPVIVLENKKLVGVVTKFDVVRAFSNVMVYSDLLEKYRKFP